MLRYLVDEDLRGPFWQAVLHHNLWNSLHFDAIRVGDPGAPDCGTPDGHLLSWAEQNDRVLVSRDKSTLPVHLREHLAKGHHSPGIFIVRTRGSVAAAVEFLALAAHASASEEWRDRIEYIN